MNHKAIPVNTFIDLLCDTTLARYEEGSLDDFGKRTTIKLAYLLSLDKQKAPDNKTTCAHGSNLQDLMEASTVEAIRIINRDFPDLETIDFSPFTQQRK